MSLFPTYPPSFSQLPEATKDLQAKLSTAYVPVAGGVFGVVVELRITIKVEVKAEISLEITNTCNRGISGNRVVDLYARIKVDVWNLAPDVLSILIGINDIWHELSVQNEVDIHRFEQVYKMMIADTKKHYQIQK